MSEKREVTVSVFNEERYRGNWPPEDEAGFLKWFTDKFSEVPAEFRDTLSIRLDSESGYSGSHNPSINIEYERPETDEEFSSRTNREKDESQRRLHAAYQTYIELKNKFEK